MIGVFLSINVQYMSVTVIGFFTEMVRVTYFIREGRNDGSVMCIELLGFGPLWHGLTPHPRTTHHKLNSSSEQHKLICLLLYHALLGCLLGLW